jgi:DHHC palmitoyltransferase
MIGFTRYKFFVQFVTYTGLFCCYIIASMSPVSSTLYELVNTTKILKQNIDRRNTFPTTWVVTLILAGFFALFMVPFSSTHIWFICHNITTNESFDRKVRTYTFNLLIDDNPPLSSSNPSSSARVVVSSEPGENPWDLSLKRNWESIMGDRVWDWVFPIRGSMGDGVRFEYNERVLEKLRAKGKEIVRMQSSITVTPSSSRCAASASEGEKASTVVESGRTE